MCEPTRVRCAQACCWHDWQVRLRPCRVRTCQLVQRSRVVGAVALSTGACDSCCPEAGDVMPAEQRCTLGGPTLSRESCSAKSTGAK